MFLNHNLVGEVDYVIIGDERENNDAPPFAASNAGQTLDVALITAGVHNKVGLIEINRDGTFEELSNIDEIRDKDGLNFYELCEKHGVKHVMTLGRQLAATISPGYTHKKTLDKLLKFPLGNIPEYNFKLAVVMHHAQVERNLDSDPGLLDSWIDRFKFLVFGQKESEYNVEWEFVDWNGLQEFLNDIMWSGYKGYLGLDYESNAADLFSVDFRITGFSIAKKIGDKDAKSVWYNVTGKETPEQLGFLRDFLVKFQEQIVAFNCPYEIKTTWHWLDVFCKFIDAIVTLTMHGERSSLKDAARRYLHADFWEGSVHEWKDRWAAIFKDMKKRCTPEQIAEIQSGEFNIEHHLALKAEYEKLVEAAPTKAAKNRVPVNFNQFMLDKIAELSEELEESEIIYLASFYPYEWGAIPREILGEYCCYDSAYGVFIHEMFYDKYKDGYNVYMLHPYLASIFEANGIRWDDEEATKEYDYCMSKMSEHLVSLIPNLKLPPDQMLTARDFIYRELPYENVWYTPGGQERRKMVTTLAGKIADLSGFFNPNSNDKANKEKFWKAYLTDEVEMCTMLWSVMDQLKVHDYWDKTLLAISKGFVPKDSEKLEKEFFREFPVDEILTRIIQFGDTAESKHVRELIAMCVQDGLEAYEERFTNKFKADVLDAQLAIHQLMLGVNPDDESTWNTSFRMMVDLKMYKRHYKQIATYIDGKVGRQTVWAAKLRDGLPPLRVRKYDWDNPKLQDGEDCYIMTPDFNSLAAITSRWQAGIHNVPGDSTLRNIWVSKPEGGLWYHQDFSQAELVMVSVFADDSDMKNVFLSGGDMHRFVSSIAYQKTEPEVTDVERKGGKAINFALVYQSSLESVAMVATGGDMERAQNLMDTVFGKFTGLKAWIDATKKNGFETGYAYGYFGNRINLEGTNVNSTSVNYPIQNTSSMVAGAGMYFLDEDFKQSNMEAETHIMVHDSLDTTSGINEMFKVFQKTRENMEGAIRELWDMPMRTDIEFGARGGSLMGLDDYGVNEDGSGWLIVEGRESALEKLLEALDQYSQWTPYVEILKEKEKLNSIANSFNSKSGIRSDGTGWGCKYIELKAKITLEPKHGEKAA